MAGNTAIALNSAAFRIKLAEYQSGAREAEELVFASIRKGCMKHADRLIDKYRIMRVTAHDIAQEVCIQLFTGKMKTYDPQKGCFNAWLSKVIERELIALTRPCSYRKEHPFNSFHEGVKHGEGVFHNVKEEGVSAEELVEQKETKKRALEVLSVLNDTQKAVLIETKWYKKSVQETGEAMGKSGNWASGVLHSAKKKLEKKLRELQIEDSSDLNMAA